MCFEDGSKEQEPKIAGGFQKLGKAGKGKEMILLCSLQGEASADISVPAHMILFTLLTPGTARS